MNIDDMHIIPLVKKKPKKNDRYIIKHNDHNIWLKSIGKKEISLDQYIRYIKGRRNAFDFEEK